jgi:type I restriction enzyme M protein
VHDPACGTGGLLADVVSHLQGRSAQAIRDHPRGSVPWRPGAGTPDTLPDVHPVDRELGIVQHTGAAPPAGRSDLASLVTGQDVSRSLTRIATVNLVLRGVRHPQISWGDSLEESRASLGDPPDVIVCDPPPGLSSVPSTDPALSVAGHRVAPPAGTERAELLFLNLCMTMLGRRGRCAVVVPDGLLSTSSLAVTEVRRRLVQYLDLLAVVSIPYGTHRAAILVFRQRPAGREGSGADGAVWFSEVGAAALPGPGRRVAAHGYPFGGSTSDLLEDWQRYRVSGFRQPPGVPAGVLLPSGSVPPRSWWAPRRAVAVNGFRLEPARYRPRVAAPAPAEDPRDLIREALRIERDIVSDLEELLDQIARLETTDESHHRS